MSTDSYERKDEFKRSGLGRNILFLFMFEEEMLKNRIVCKKFVEKWLCLVYEFLLYYGDIYVGWEIVDTDERRSKKSKTSVVDYFVDVGMNVDVVSDELKYGECGYCYYVMVFECLLM